MSFFPAKRADFVIWSANCAAILAATPADYGLTIGQAGTLTAADSSLQVLYITSTTPETRTPVSIQAFDTQRIVVTQLVQTYNNMAQLLPATPEALTSAGFPIRQTVRTPQTPVTAEIDLVLVSAAAGITRMSARNPATPTSKRKPLETGAVQVATAIGTTVAVDPNQATESLYYTKTPFDILTEPSQRGKIMVVWARYQSRGSIGAQKVYGPWSLPVQVHLV